jgi:hypothetical protein
MTNKTRCWVLAIIAGALFTFPSIALGQKQQSISHLDKIYSIIRVTIDKMQKEGVTPKNARVRNVQRRYGGGLIQFDQRGRCGLLLDLTALTRNLTGRLEALGGAIDLSLPYAKLISVYMPIDKIEEIAQWSEIRTIRPMTGGVTNTGSVTSEGDSIHHAINIRTDLNVLGDSINVGVISDGCVSWLASQAKGDLPLGFGPPNYTFGGINRKGWGDEGTAMMEIIHDLAPNAKLFFYGALYDTVGNFRSSAAMVEGIHLLVTEKKCNVIVDDLTWYDEPMFEDRDAATSQFVAAAAQWAIDTLGVVYISSAGNFGGPGTYGHCHYQSLYSDINGASGSFFKPLPGPPPNIPPPGSAAYPLPYDNLHNFSQTAGWNDPGLQVIIPPYGTVNVILEWNDPWGASADDYDLYLYNRPLNAMLSMSIGVQNGAQNPYEAVYYYNDYPVFDTVNAVVNHFGTSVTPKLLGMYIFGCSNAEYPTPQNSIWGQPGVPDVIAVGAVPATNINVIEGFSSHGNYDVYFPAYGSRPKPDVVAVDEVLITGAGGFGYVDGQGNSRFRGTSAAAPHIAGLAALLLSKCPAMTAAQVHAKFERTAFPIAGGATIYGSGRADIERAMLEVDPTVGASGLYVMNSTFNVPMFFADDSGYAINNIKVTGGGSPPGAVVSKVTVTAGSPYASAGVVDLGCPSIKRWYELTQFGGTNGQFDATITAYIDESERAASGVAANNLKVIHWNGSYFDILPQFAAPVQVANTWKIQATFNNASFSPFFVGYLTRGIGVSAVSSCNGKNDSTVSVEFSIGNSGNGWDMVLFHAGDKLGWTIAPTDSEFSITSGHTSNISIRVTIPHADTVGTIDTVRLIAKSVSDTTLKDTAYATVKIIPTTIEVSCNMMKGWNMVSLPVTAADCRKDSVFRTASSKAFTYKDGYVSRDTIKNGVGYWIKVDSAHEYCHTGIPRTNDTISVLQKWNMVGGISYPVSVSNIVALTPGLNLSSFYAYDSGYVSVDTIKPGRGYWVKANKAGQFVLADSSAVTSETRIMIIRIDELPPLPPGENCERAKIEIPADYALRQNYPNPFNPSTVIKYDLPAPSHVRLIIYNILGQAVAGLADGVQEPGYQEAVWNASHAASGVYYYSIEAMSIADPAKSFVQTKKMILIK